ncbi:MAG: hypothetical protein LBR26_11855 [Prevotella sp.]|nr:hypothetical protein [Prevotella sp.]
MPKALQNPFAVLINSIRGIFPKDTHEWVNWINQGKGLYFNKEKVLNFLDQQRINPADVAFGLPDNQAQQENSKLSAANIVQNFENPKNPKKKIRDGEESIDESDRVRMQIVSNTYQNLKTCQKLYRIL